MNAAMRSLRAAAGAVGSVRPRMRAFARRVDEGLRDRHPPIDPADVAITARLGVAFRTAKRDQTTAARGFRPDTVWAADLDLRLARYLDALAAEDVDGLRGLLADFLRNEAIRGLWTQGYFEAIAAGTVVDKRVFAEQVMADVEAWRERVDAELDELVPPPIGNPWGCMVDGRLVMPVSPRHHYYAARADALLVGRPAPLVAEIGGGFGGFARFLRRRRPDVTYVDFDLPETLLLAGWYLLQAFPDARVALYGECELSAESLAAYDILLLPNFALERLPAESVDLFICTASLSELDTVAATAYLEAIRRTTRGVFLNESFDRPDLPSLETSFELVEQLPSPWAATTGRYSEAVWARRL